MLYLELLGVLGGWVEPIKRNILSINLMLVPHINGLKDSLCRVFYHRLA